MLLIYPKQPLVFEKCVLSDLKRGHVIDSEASDSLSIYNVCVRTSVTLYKGAQ